MKKITLLLFTLLSISLFGQDKLTSSIDYNLSNGEWVLSSKHEYTYNASGFVLQDVYLSNFNSNNFQLLNNSRSRYIYNSSNRVTEEINQFWDDDNNSFVTNYKTIYSYNASNQVTEFISYEVDNTGSEPINKFVFSYDNNNRIANGISYSWNGSSWFLKFEDSERTTLTYNANNLVETAMYEFWNGNQWEIEGRDFYTYDSNNKLVLEEIQSWNGSSWDAGDEKTEYTYDANGNRISQESFYLDNGVWVVYNSVNNGEKYHFDTTALMTDFASPFKDKTGFEFLLNGGDSHYINKLKQYNNSYSNKTIYYYNYENDKVFDSNKLTGRLLETNHSLENQWNESQKRLYEYDDQKNLTQMLYLNSDGFSFGNVNDVIDMEYNSNNKITLYYSKKYNIDTDEFENNLKVQYSYNGNGKNTEYIVENWDNNQWNNNYKREFSYSNNKLISYIDYGWNGTNWVIDDTSWRFTYTYGANDLIETEIFETNDGSNWANSWKYTHTYNSDGKLVLKNNESWENDSWVLKGKEENEFDTNSNRVKNIIYEYRDENWIEWYTRDYLFDESGLFENFSHPFKSRNGNAIYFGNELYNNKISGYLYKDVVNDNEERVTYFYGGEASVLSVEDYTDAKNLNLLNIQVYPNPTTSTIKIDDSNFSIKNVEIFNVIGKKVINSTKNELNLQHLVNGVYLLKIETESGKIATKRIIKN